MTDRVDDGLRAVTLNFETADEADRIWSLSALLAEVLAEFGPLHAPDPPLAESVRLAQRISAIAPQISRFDQPLVERIDHFLGPSGLLRETGSVAGRNTEQCADAHRGPGGGMVRSARDRHRTAGGPARVLGADQPLDARSTRTPARSTHQSHTRRTGNEHDRRGTGARFRLLRRADRGGHVVVRLDRRQCVCGFATAFRHVGFPIRRSTPAGCCSHPHIFRAATRSFTAQTLAD